MRTALVHVYDEYTAPPQFESYSHSFQQSSTVPVQFAYDMDRTPGRGLTYSHLVNCGTKNMLELNGADDLIPVGPTNPWSARFGG